MQENYKHEAEEKSVTMPNVFSMQKKGTVLQSMRMAGDCLTPIPWQITVSM